jgi:hypothetical protein
MGLDWNVMSCTTYVCNGVELEPNLDGTTVHMLADIGLSPYMPLLPATVQQRDFPDAFRTTLTTDEMRLVANLVAERATCAEHYRIAAWLATWAEADYSLNISY